MWFQSKSKLYDENQIENEWTDYRFISRYIHANASDNTCKKSRRISVIDLRKGLVKMGSFTCVYKSKSIIKMVKSIGISPVWIWHYSVAVCIEKLSCPVVSCCEH